jgi:hypothetical protein
MKGRRVLQHWNGNGEQRIRDQIQVKIKLSASQPCLVLIIADVGSQMGRLATIFCHAGSFGARTRLRKVRYCCAQQTGMYMHRLEATVLSLAI